MLLDAKRNRGSTAGMIFPLNQIEPVTSEQFSQWTFKNQKPASRPDIANKTFPNLINPFRRIPDDANEA
jgi:hypothetical protein